MARESKGGPRLAQDDTPSVSRVSTYLSRGRHLISMNDGNDDGVPHHTRWSLLSIRFNAMEDLWRPQMQLKLGLAALFSAMCWTVFALPAQAQATDNSCPMGSAMICSLEGCWCRCPDGAAADLTTPQRACPQIANQSSGGAVLTPPAVNGSVSRSRNTQLPALRPLRIPTPQTPHDPLPQTGDPAQGVATANPNSVAAVPTPRH